MANRGSQDRRLELAVGQLLRVGVTLSAAVVLASGSWYLLRPTGPRLGYRTFRGAAGALSSPSIIFHGALAGDSRSIIQLGLLILIATPIARVILAAAGFMFERDWLYTLVSVMVLAILLFSLVFGR